MAGTTIRDDGLVEQAFTVALAGQGVAPGTFEHERTLAWVRKTMGKSRIEVFRMLLDGVVVLSACPQDIVGFQPGGPTDMAVELLGSG